MFFPPKEVWIQQCFHEHLPDFRKDWVPSSKEAEILAAGEWEVQEVPENIFLCFSLKQKGENGFSRSGGGKGAACLGARVIGQGEMRTAD